MRLGKAIDVAVVGAGPVGLFAALNLVRERLRVGIFDQGRRTGVHSYALALHPATLLELDEHGLAEPLIQKGRRIEAVVIREEHERRTRIPIDTTQSFPFVLVVPQSELERVLESALRREGVQVRWNHRLQELDTARARPRLEMVRLDPVTCGYPVARTEWVVAKELSVEASYVVGADGYHSRVREQLGIEMERIGPAEHFAVFEFDVSEDPGSEVNLVVDEHGTSVLWPMAGSACRWSFATNSGVGVAGSPDERLCRMIEARAPWAPRPRGLVRWSCPVHFERRRARHFGRDRGWLAGDAAHSTSPVGAQSMNAGMHEARDLARSIGIASRGDPATLAVYGERWLDEWRWLLGPGSRLQACLPGTGAALGRMVETAESGSNAPTG